MRPSVGTRVLDLASLIRKRNGAVIAFGLGHLHLGSSRREGDGRSHEFWSHRILDGLGKYAIDVSHGGPSMCQPITSLIGSS